MGRRPSPRRESVRDQIRGFLAGRPRTAKELIARIHLPGEQVDDKLVRNVLHELKSKGELAYTLKHRTYSLAAGEPVPPAAARPTAGAITTPPVPRDTGPPAPSRFTGPPKPDPPAPAPPAADPEPGDTVDPERPVMTANGIEKTCTECFEVESACECPGGPRLKANVRKPSNELRKLDTPPRPPGNPREIPRPRPRPRMRSRNRNIRPPRASRCTST